jgi:hypothetical protein
VWRVNWVYLIWALGYEAVWVTIVPAQLVDLMFPARREEPWIGRRGVAWAAIFFTLASVIAWYSWTQSARQQVFHVPLYNPPPAYLAMAVAAILALIAAAYRLGGAGTMQSGTAPRPAMVGLAVALLAAPWSAPVLLAYGAAPQMPYRLAIAGSLAWAAAALVFMRRWSFRTGWQDGQRYDADCGAIAGCMAGGFVLFAMGGASRVDWIGKIVFDAAAVALLAARVRR